MGNVWDGVGDGLAAMVVDDELMIRLLIADTIRDLGFSVIEAGDAHEALANLCENGSLDLLVTDVRMPGPIDGLGLAKAARSKRPEIKILLVSAHVNGPIPFEFADAVLAKPFNSRELASEVSRLMQPAA